MTLRPAVVRSRLAKLRQVLTNLEVVRRVPRGEFVSDFQHYWLGERGLHLAAETVFDIGNHILASHFNVHPSEYEEVLERLAEQEVISPALRGKLEGLGGFRNVLVHAYMDIDTVRVYETLQHELSAFDAFAEEVESFLDAVTGG